eukprot:IDg12624t1
MTLHAEPLFFAFVLIFLIAVIADNKGSRGARFPCKSSRFPFKPWRARFENPNVQRYCQKTRFAHVFWASSDAPISSSLGTKAYENVLYFNSTFDHIAKLAARKREQEYKPLRCTTHLLGERMKNGQPDATRFQRKWAHAALLAARNFGFKMPNTHCFTAVELPTNSNMSRKLSANLASFYHELNLTAARLATLAKQAGSTQTTFQRILARWSVTEGTIERTVSDDLFECRVTHISAFRLGGSWNVGTRFTNAPLEDTLEENGRHFLGEVVGADHSGKLKALPLTLYKEGDIKGLKNDTTTSLSRWGGVFQTSYFRPMMTSDVSVMQRVRKETQLERQYLLETIVPSNMAILALPIFLTLVPISCIEHVHSWVLVVYSLISDVLATLPIAIV